MTRTAVQMWAAWLDEWRIPPQILEAAPENPWSFPAELFDRRAEASLDAPLTVSGHRARAALIFGGTVLDVGAGGGAALFSLRDHASAMTAVDSSTEALDGLRGRADRLGLEVGTVIGSWPDVAAEVDAHDVVLCHHVVYNVPDIEPFLRALDSSARRRVVIELTDRHPMASLSALWREFHGIRRSDRPTASDFIAVLDELGFHASIKRWPAAPAPALALEDRVALARRRLCLPSSRDADVARALAELEPGHDIRATVWWDPISGRRFDA
ncbi:MAG: methyltransferase domain-containing protein [Chloroflexi bacterium]|nr:methyltransferase domain-containing protein [Chloroflexota bacterium]